MRATDVDVNALRAAAEAAGGCGMVEDCTDPNHEWYGSGELEARLDGGLGVYEAAQHVALAKPSVVLGLLDRLQAAEAAVERVRAVVRNDRAAREACARDEDCGCAYKDCYECGKWHNCTHTPLAAVQTALDGPQDDAGADLSASGAESDHGGRRDGEVLA